MTAGFPQYRITDDDARLRVYRALALGAIALGAVLRLAHYLDNRPLGIDDLRLALNVGTRSFWGITHALDYNQAAPIPFLWAEWLVTRAAGYGDYALRLVPVACAVLLLPMVWLAGRRILGEREAVLATLFASLSVFLIHYGTAVKPYELDALVTVCLLALAARTLADPAIRRRWQELGIGGTLAIVASLPAVFVLAGVGAALVVDPDIRRDPRSRRRALAVAGAWLATFGVMYAAVDRSTAADPYMRWFWGTTFLTPGMPHFAQQVLNDGREALVLPFYYYVDAAGHGREKLLAALVLVLCGLAALTVRRAWTTLALLGVPYGAVLVALIAGRYPGGARLLLFLSPVLFLLAAAGLVAVVDAVSALVLRVGNAPPSLVRGIAYGALIVAALAWRLPAALRYVGAPPPGADDIRHLARLVENASDKDPVYVDAAAVPAWYFYTTDWSAPDGPRLAWIARQAIAGGPAFENALPRGYPVRPQEGVDLADVYGGRREVVGLAAGVGRREVEWDYHAHADTGWAANEAWRLREAADTAAWIVSAEYHPTATMGAFLTALRQYGGRIVWARVNDGAALYRVHFASPRTAGST